MLTKIAYFIARFAAAIIMGQTLYFKFTSSPESIYIFTTVGMEPWGRWLVGILELVAAVTLVIPRTAWLGGALAVGLMIGAIGMHLTVLGIEVMGDKGQLFYYAMIIFLCGLYVVFNNREKIFNEVLPKILNRK
ncbi:DoxX-like family protein [Ekhidna lutea]|uniref:DoxX-like family protein n=1 Tax=Ekhidna lutea TaxID=447679 RepID=A0A239LH70_EKHLU|nr:DoxX family protein [Ekhidna lutea]SNT29640.1 DoxX-like family protein [Ekhidna lutea]